MLSSNTSAVSGDTVYVEDVFSTWLYTGNSSTQTITNGIDLSTKGGAIFTQRRTGATGGTYNGAVVDTARGVSSSLATNSTASATGGLGYSDVSSFNIDGYSLGYDTGLQNTSGNTYASWTFRKQPKFFDVVTYTGTGSPQDIPHSLGSVPGCIIVKGLTSTPTSPNWAVYHRSLGNDKQIQLNLTNAVGGSSITSWNNTDPTSTVFTVGTTNTTNASGQTYVAYIFAHDAGGFGLTGTDNVISCGSYTGNNTSLQSINLGYEPQLVLIKSASIAGTEWAMLDNMRGVATGGVDAVLNPNTSGAEASPFDRVDFTSTGFNLKTSSSIYNETGTYIYIAIRRGPMKVPTDGTKVFSPNAYTGAGAGTTVSIGFPPDMQIVTNRDATANGSKVLYDRLRAGGRSDLLTNATDAEVYGPTYNQDFNRLQTQIYSIGSNGYTSSSGKPYISYAFQRAPSFFDVVCYTGTGTAQTVTHNLGVAPEMIINKSRSDALIGWPMYVAALGNNQVVRLNTTSAAGLSSGWNNTTPTSTQFSINGYNTSGVTYVAYLFATCAGVSKVGSYTGTGTTKQVDCGFAAGARFVLIKRTDSTGDWYVWDTARGIVSGNDPYLLLNSTAAEDTSTDYIDTYSAGFELSSTAPAALNASGGTYIFLAIA